MENVLLIILAAGKSSRMGFPKGLLKNLDGYFLESHIKSFAKSGGKNVVIIFSKNVEKYRQALTWIPENISEMIQYEGVRIKILINPQSHLGQFSSLLLGTNEFLKSDLNGAFILTVDTPPPKASTWNKLKDNLIHPKQVITPQFNKKGGHPILINRFFAEGLNRHSPELSTSRLDWIIKNLSKEDRKVIPIMDPNLTLNLNTQEDFNRVFEQAGE